MRSWRLSTRWDFILPASSCDSTLHVGTHLQPFGRAVCYQANMRPSTLISCCAADPPYFNPLLLVGNVRPVVQAHNSSGTLHLQPFRAMLSQAADGISCSTSFCPIHGRVARVILALCTGDGARLANVHSIGRVQRLAAMGASTVALGELHWAVRSCPAGKMSPTLQHRMASQARLTRFRLNFQPPVVHPLGVQPTVQPTRDPQSISCWAVGPPSYLKLPLGTVSSGAHSPPLASCTVPGALPVNPHLAHMAPCLPVVHG